MILCELFSYSSPIRYVDLESQRRHSSSKSFVPISGWTDLRCQRRLEADFSGFSTILTEFDLPASDLGSKLALALPNPFLGLTDRRRRRRFNRHRALKRRRPRRCAFGPAAFGGANRRWRRSLRRSVGVSEPESSRDRPEERGEINQSGPPNGELGMGECSGSGFLGLTLYNLNMYVYKALRT